MDDPYGGETDVSGDEEEEEEDASARSSPKATAGGQMSRIKRSLPSDSSSDERLVEHACLLFLKNCLTSFSF